MEEEDDEEDIRLMAEKGRAQARRKRFTEQATKGRKKRDAGEEAEGAAEDEAAAGEAGEAGAAGAAGALEAPPAKRAKKGKADKGKAVEAEATGGRAWGGPAGVRAAGARRPKGGKEPRQTDNPVDMPDDAKYEDEGEQKQVGGRQAQYDSDDVVEGMDGAETAQAAIERQAEAIVLGQLLLRGDKKRKLVDEVTRTPTRTPTRTRTRTVTLSLSLSRTRTRTPTPTPTPTRASTGTPTTTPTCPSGSPTTSASSKARRVTQWTCPRT
jgi:hypothetical protein